MTEVEAVEALFKDQPHGYAVELGAGDGVHLSTTLALEQRGWDVLCIEPMAELAAACRKARKRVVQVACSDVEAESADLWLYRVGNGSTSGNHGVAPMLELIDPKFAAINAVRPVPHEIRTARVTTLDRALEQAEFPSLDFLSLDVDGIEKKILCGFDITRWQPLAALVENTFNDEEMVAWFAAHGYRRGGRGIGGINDLFISDARCPLVPA